MGIDSLQDFRDVTIVAFTIAGTVLFLLGIIACLLLVIILLLVRSTISNVNTMVKDSLPATLDNLRESSENIRNTSAYMGEHAVKPIIRVYSIFAGGKRFARVMGGMFQRGGKGRRGSRS